MLTNALSAEAAQQIRRPKAFFFFLRKKTIYLNGTFLFSFK